ncbi:hypothetical protein D3C85_1137110 [compost metagenome]
MDETLPVASRVQVIAKTHAWLDAVAIQVGHRLAIEAHDIAQHSPEARRQQIAALGEEGVEVVAVVFQAAVRIVDGKAHLGRARDDAQAIHQTDEVGVGPVVEDDETGVHGITLALPLDVDSMGMAADPVGCFKHGHLVAT